MKTVKRIASILFVSVVLLTLTLPVYAEESSQPLLQEQLSDIDMQLDNFMSNNSITQKEKENAQKRASYLKGLISGTASSSKFGARSSSISNYVPYCKQDTDYYCGPASVQQTLGHYHYAPIPPQSSIYSKTGTDTTAICNYLNSLLNASNDPSYVKYTVWWNSSNKNMKTTVTAISGSGTPIIVHVKDISKSDAVRSSYTDTANWPYQTSGHYMSISGYKENGNKIELTDPYIMWSSKGKADSRYAAGKYYIDFSALNKKTDRMIT